MSTEAPEWTGWERPFPNETDSKAKECPVTCGRMIPLDKMEAHLRYHETHPPYEGLDFDAPNAMVELVGKQVDGSLGPGEVVLLRTGRLAVRQQMGCDECGYRCENSITVYEFPDGNGRVVDFNGRTLCDLRNDMYYCDEHGEARRKAGQKIREVPA